MKTYVFVKYVCSTKDGIRTRVRNAPSEFDITILKDFGLENIEHPTAVPANKVIELWDINHETKLGWIKWTWYQRSYPDSWLTSWRVKYHAWSQR